MVAAVLLVYVKRNASAGTGQPVFSEQLSLQVGSKGAALAFAASGGLTLNTDIAKENKISGEEKSNTSWRG